MPKTSFNKLVSYHWNKERTKLKCSSCGEYKLPDDFDSNSSKPHREYKDSRCKECKSTATRKRKLQRYNADPLRRILVERLAGAKERAKKSGVEVSITIEDLLSLYNTQSGKCAISNIELTYIMGEGRVPTNISIDQIEPSNGYTIGNVQIVCMAVNQMKSDLSSDDLLMFCNAIADNAKKWKK